MTQLQKEEESKPVEVFVFTICFLVTLCVCYFVVSLIWAFFRFAFPEIWILIVDFHKSIWF